MDAVTQVLSVRSQDADGLQRMLGASVLGHLALATVVFLAPASWFSATVQRESEAVMTISLGGAPGPKTGMTTLGGRPIQQAVPLEAKRAIEPVRPPAAREPEMIEPKTTAPKKAETKVQETVKTPTGRTPTKGEEVRQGSAVAETFGRGKGFGLSAGGGGVSGHVDTANFCCPEYLATMVELIRRNWDNDQQAAGTTVVKYTIQRDGTITAVQVEKPSGYAALDLMADRALRLTKQLPALPGAFTEPSLTVHLIFEYSR